MEGIGRKHHEMRMTLLEREAELARVREENQRLRTPQSGGAEGAQPAGGQPKPASDADGAAGVVKVFELLAQKHGLAPAVGFLMAEQQKAAAAAVADAVKQVREELSGLIEPLQQTHAQAQKEQYADQLINGLAALRTSEGQQAFPELADQNKVAEISELMAEMGFEEHHMLSPKTVMAAVGLYRMKHGWSAAQVAAAAQTTTTPPAEALAAAASVAGVSGDPPARPPVPQTDAERIRSEMLKAGGGSDSTFGGMRL